MVPMREVRAIAWHLYWRFLLAAFISYPIIGFIMGYIGGSIYGVIAYPNAQIETAKLIGGIIGLIIGPTLGFFILNYFISRMIGRNIRGKKVALMEIGS